MSSNYGFSTTAEEIARNYDLTGKNVIVTGGYAGIGKETARVFALIGAHVFVVGRDVPKANKAVEDLKKETGKDHITAMEVDLASFESIREFAEQFNQLNIPLHYLILNAGIMACPFAKTKDGFESQFGVNGLGHFLLANLLVPRLIEGAPSRVVSVSSAGHCMSDIRYDDYNWEKGPYDQYEAYGQSKTANILFAVEFTRRYKDQGVIANSLHPGAIHTTELARHLKPDDLSPEKIVKLSGWNELKTYNLNPKTEGQGAATTIYAALAPETAEGAKFYEDCKERLSRPYASDPENAKRFWDLATKLVSL